MFRESAEETVVYDKTIVLQVSLLYFVMGVVLAMHIIIMWYVSPTAH